MTTWISPLDGSVRDAMGWSGGNAFYNYGSDATLYINTGIIDYFWFPLTGIPSGAIISSAIVTFHKLNSTPSVTIRLWALLVDWIETEVTYNQRKIGVAWTSNGGNNTTDRESVAAGSGHSTNNVPGAFSIDITDIVSRWFSGVLVNNGVLVDGIEGGEQDIASSEHATSGPYLTVEYTLASTPKSTSGRLRTAAMGGRL
jgi:hypothetical protein